MNYRFAAHEALLHLREALNKYPNPDLLQQINELIALVQNRKFIVAVAGEFNRGKSSLINALLGMPILPMDILPMTATANRIVYGLSPRVQILKKDGSKLQINVDELANYVTKVTDEAHQNAKSIQETVIEYPTVLCQNGVEILDTPGLNDTEEMQSITSGILQKAHAVVFAVSATIPLGMSEVDWLAGMMKSDQLQYLMFAVTFFDRVARRDRQKVLDNIRERIATMVQQRVAALYPDMPELMEKARRLTDPETVFLMPVSSRDALDAFDLGDDELLQNSNLPKFKQALMTALNAQQDEYAVKRAAELLRQVEAWLQEAGGQKAKGTEIQALDRKCDDALGSLQGYREDVALIIRQMRVQMEAAVINTPSASEAMREAAARVLQAHEGKIQTNEDVHNTLNAASAAVREAAKAHYLEQWSARYLAGFKSHVELIEARRDRLLYQCRMLLDSLPPMQNTLDLKKKLWAGVSASVIPQLPASWTLDITGGFLKGIVSGGQKMAETIGKSVSSAADYIEKKSFGFRKMKGKFEDFMQKSGIADKVNSIDLNQLDIKEGVLTGRNLYQECVLKISEATTHLLLAWNKGPEQLAGLLKRVYLDEETFLTDTALQLALMKRKGEINATLTQHLQESEENYRNAADCLAKAAKSLEVQEEPDYLSRQQTDTPAI